MVNRSVGRVLACSLLVFALQACGDEDVSGPTKASDASLDITAGPDGSADVDSGLCVGKADGEVCDDGDPCTLDDACTAGLCVGGSNDPCSSDNPCELGTCVAGVGCQFDSLDDGTLCEAACFETASCQGGECKVDPDSAVVCPDPDPVTQSCVAELICDVTTGTCSKPVFHPVDTECDTDSNRCTLEVCSAEGVCTNTGESVSCDQKAADDPCQTWACDKKDGICDPIGFAGEVSCNDGNGCTMNDTCMQDEFSFIACKGTPVAVDDGNPCTDDSCVAGEILHTPVNGLPCITGDECSPNGLCQDAVCEFEGCTCYDDDDCPEPEDKCLGETFCDTSGDTPSCQLKEGTAVVCEAPASPCFIAACVPETGGCSVVPAPLGTACDDGNACTLQDVCDGTGECTAGSSLNCDNGVYCDGPEACDPVGGCIPGIPPSLSDGIECTIDSCNEETDSVDHLGEAALCSDGDACNGTELCDPSEGCKSGIPLDCDDGAYCNGPETCESGVGCMPGVPPSLDDGFECTVEVCNEETDTFESIANNALCIPPDGLCLVGLCDPAAGGCSTTPKANCCGNGLVEAGEACDDGNGVEGDGCFQCTVEEEWTCEGSPSACQTCGDGLVQGTEVCDAGVNNGCQSCKKDCSGPIQVYPGNAVIKTQADLDKFTAYTVIDGNLLVDNYKEASISLPALECVKGYLQVNYTEATDLSGLANLGYVGDLVQIQGNAKLTSVSGLEGLTHAKLLKVQDNDALLNLDGLQGLQSVETSVILYGNKLLESVAGLKNLTASLSNDFTLSYNDALMSLQGLEGIEETHHLNIVGNDMLPSLSGLGLLKVGGNLRIAGNDSLEVLDGLEGLSKIHWELRIEDNPQLLNLAGLVNVSGTTGSRVRISNNAKLESLEGLAQITKVNAELALENLPSLGSLAGLEQVQEIAGNLLIQKCNGLKSLANLATLTSANDIRLQYNTGLETLDLPSFGDQVGGSLYIVGNSNLVSIASLSTVQDIIGGLYVGKNTELKSLAGLENVAEVGNVFSVYDNASLGSLAGLSNLTSVGAQANVNQNNQLASLAGLENLASVGGTLSIQKNAGLQHVDALAGLEFVGGGLSIYDNDDLLNIDGMSGLINVGDSIYVDNNAKLANIDGLSGLTSNNSRSVYVRYNDLLTSIEGLKNFKGTLEMVELTANKKLQSVSGLGGILSISNGLIIRGTDTLQDLVGLGSLQSAGYLTVEGNSGLKSLSGLESLKSLGNVTLENNLQLQTLSGLEGLIGSVGVLRIVNNPLLSSLDALAMVTAGYSIIISECPSLETLSGLDGFQQLSGAGGIVLRLIDNVKLTNVDALGNISLQEVKGELRLDNNVSLANLDGLGGFGGVMSGSIWVSNNSALTSISGLSAITKTTLVKVVNNVQLDQCHVHEVVGDIEANNFCVQGNAVAECPDDC